MVPVNKHPGHHQVGMSFLPISGKNSAVEFEIPNINNAITVMIYATIDFKRRIQEVNPAWMRQF